MIIKLQTVIDKLKKQKNFEIYRINSKAPLIRKGEKNSGNYYRVFKKINFWPRYSMSFFG